MVLGGVRSEVSTARRPPRVQLLTWQEPCCAPGDSSVKRPRTIPDPAYQRSSACRQAGLAAVSNVLQQYSNLLRRISNFGIAPAADGKFDPKIENEQSSNATGALLRAAKPVNAPPSTVYRVYLAVMHGELYGLMNFMAPGVTSTGPVLHCYLPPDVFDSTVQITIVAFQQVYQRIAKVMGWSPLGDLWDAKIRKIYLRAHATTGGYPATRARVSLVLAPGLVPKR
jgi:hypothetical protein